MINHPTMRLLVMAVGPALLTTACSDSGAPLDPNAEPTVLLSVVPEGGATNVDRFAPIVIEFDHELMEGMQAFALLHEGEVTGPEVDGSWALGADRRTLVFTPTAPLSPNATYTIHLGGAMKDANGRDVNLQEHGDHMGGTWASPGMMGAGPQGGGTMGGAMNGEHTGTGWGHATNGSYGMVFSFTTGS
ncbi:MAG: Ig-like domain-containing protein [Gemmatimonadetes bacterium]|nr:Ig-like domain-containing protein [Gemmatimonadota bacterium]NNF38359.1 Ig-like domain-containing protein [Gemmatimonadota bacterium]NNK63961.1 Ig-like domain-containing protein [Gemmatimonadota bacterium]